MKVLFGIDIGGTNVKIGLFDLNNKLLYKTSIKTNKISTQENIFSDIKEATNKILQEQNLKDEDVLGYGFGIPGPVINNVVTRCPNLGWSKTDLNPLYTKYFGNKVFTTGNDASVAAYGEYKTLNIQKDVIFMTLGTGVGGGVIANGKLVEGAHGSAGEIGHIQVEYDNPKLCSCGLRGCLETVASIRGFKEVAKDLLKDYKGQSELSKIPINPPNIFKAAAKGDKLANDIIVKVSNYIAMAGAKMAVVTDPAYIIIGGGISNAGKPLIDQINKAYQNYSYYATVDLEFKQASLLNDAGIIGAYYLIKDKIK